MVKSQIKRTMMYAAAFVSRLSKFNSLINLLAAVVNIDSL